MGKSNKSSLKFASSDKILEMLSRFIEEKVNEKFLLIGESYGGYLALGLVLKYKQNIKGLMLLCPMIIPENEKRILPMTDLKFYDEKFLKNLNYKERELFYEYMIIANEESYQRYSREVIPGIREANDNFIKKLKGNYSFPLDIDDEIRKEKFLKPCLFIVGRQDKSVGYQDLWNLIENYPRATFTVLDVAGHNLQIEQEEVFDILVKNWIERVERYQ